MNNLNDIFEDFAKFLGVAVTKVMKKPKPSDIEEVMVFENCHKKYYLATYNNKTSKMIDESKPSKDLAEIKAFVEANK